MTIVAISASPRSIVGLTADGTVVVYGSVFEYYSAIRMWRDIVAVDCSDLSVIGVKADGTVVAAGHEGWGRCNVHNASLWKDIIAIAAADHTVGLKADGRVLATGRNEEGQCNIGDWRDIVSIAVSDFSTVGLKADGTVLAVGSNDEGQCDVTTWENVVAICASSSFTIGLTSDGTMLFAGSQNFFPDFNPMFQWKNIVALSSGLYSVIGLRSDGLMMSVSCEDAKEYCKVDQWQDIILATPEQRLNLMESRKQQDQREWERKGLCRNCGGKLSFFSKACKSCGMKN